MFGLDIEINKVMHFLIKKAFNLRFSSNFSIFALTLIALHISSASF